MSHAISYSKKYLLLLLRPNIYSVFIAVYLYLFFFPTDSCIGYCFNLKSEKTLPFHVLTINMDIFSVFCVLERVRLVYLQTSHTEVIPPQIALFFATVYIFLVKSCKKKKNGVKLNGTHFFWNLAFIVKIYFHGIEFVWVFFYHAPYSDHSDSLNK